MTFTIIYDQSGKFSDVIRTSDDGSQSSSIVNTNAWPDYLEKFGPPPPTGTPSVKPAPSADETNFQQLVTKALSAGLQAADVLALLTLAVKTGRLK